MSDSEPEIDFEHLAQYVGDDAALTKEIFGLFKNQVDIWAKQLRSDADDEIWAGVTHSLKGSAKAVGAVKLAEACERAEALIGERARQGSRQASVDQIENHISRAMIEIQRWEYRQTMKEIRGD